MGDSSSVDAIVEALPVLHDQPFVIMKCGRSNTNNIQHQLGMCMCMYARHLAKHLTHITLFTTHCNCGC